MSDVDIRVERTGKPGAVKLMQVLGGILVVFGVVPVVIGTILGYDELARIYVLAFVPFLAGLFGLMAGIRRPVGLVAGVLSLALLIATVFGAVPVAIVVFLAAKDKERVRDYYMSGLK